MSPDQASCQLWSWGWRIHIFLFLALQLLVNDRRPVVRVCKDLRLAPVFLQEDLLLKVGAALLALNMWATGVWVPCASFVVKVALHFLHLDICSSVHFEGLSTLAFEASVFALLLM